MAHLSVRRAVSAVGVLALAVGGLVAFGSGPAGAATTVSTEKELRDAFGKPAETAIDLANDITLADCAAGELSRLSAADLTLDGHGFTITQTCSGDRVMETGGGGGLTLSGITITGGDGAGAQNTGGGVFALGSLVIQGSAIVNNRAGPNGPFSGLAGGVFGQAVTISNSVISNNTAAKGSTFGGLGGAMASSGDIHISDSTISGNTAEGGTSIFAGNAGAIFTNSGVTITRSTLNGNVAKASDSAGGNGGAISTNGAVTLVNSTVTANEAQGANSTGGGVGSNNLTLVYSTIVGNSAANTANVAGAARTVFATVVARALGGGQNCAAGTVTSNGFNFSDDASCAFTNAAQGDRQNAGDPLLGALAGNGGPTQTMLPQTGSPLIDVIPTASCQADGASGITTDQRGLPRPEVTGGLCDIGAVEVQAVAPPTPSTTGGGPTPAVPVAAVVRFTG
jgi:hypothetical protein